MCISQGFIGFGAEAERCRLSFGGGLFYFTLSAWVCFLPSQMLQDFIVFVPWLRQRLLYAYGF